MGKYLHSRSLHLGKFNLKNLKFQLLLLRCEFPEKMDGVFARSRAISTKYIFAL